MGASDPLPEVIVLQKVKITIADRIQLQTRKDTVRGSITRVEDLTRLLCLKLGLPLYCTSQ